jgi:type VI secretion system protein ImpA
MMAADPLLVIDDLLAPIPGDNPAGDPVAFAVRTQLDEDRKEVNPADFDEDDPLRPTDVKWADWKGILRVCREQLTGTSKDLLLGARIAEATTKINGFAGLAEGLCLMRRLLDDCWDRLHPGIEDGDLEVRAGQFNWLGDDGRGARFPHSLRLVPLFPFEGERIHFHDCRQTQNQKGRFKNEQIEKAANETSREHVQELVDGMEAAMKEMEHLLATLNSRLGSAAPSMADLRKVMVDILAMLKQVLQKKGPPPSAETHEEGGEGGEAGAEAGNGSTGAPSRRGATREDIYQRLNETADQLARMEPHSPVPYLIRRAVALGALPFPQLMRELIRTDYAAAIDEMNRELGIKEEPPQ